MDIPLIINKINLKQQQKICDKDAKYFEIPLKIY